MTQRRNIRGNGEMMDAIRSNPFAMQIMHSHTKTQTHTNTLTQTHTQTNKHTPTHTHTHTHTYTHRGEHLLEISLKTYADLQVYCAKLGATFDVSEFRKIFTIILLLSLP